MAHSPRKGQIVRLLNRPGNIPNGKAAAAFIHDLIRQVRDAVGKGRILELRMGGAFFRKHVLRVLDPAGFEYAIKVPFCPWLNLRQVAARARRRFESIHTLRHKLLGRAAVLLKPKGKTTLHLGASPALASHFLAIQNALCE